MVSEKDLKDLGFKYKELDPYRAKPMWHLELKDDDECFKIRYDPETKECFFVPYQFSTIIKEICTKDEMKKYIESVEFLFDVNN